MDGYHRYGLPRISQGLSWVPGRLALSYFFHLRVLGRDNLRAAAQLKREKGVGLIIAANHVSNFDPIIMLSGVPPHSPHFPMYYVGQTGTSYKRGTNKKLLSLVFGEFFFYCFGNIPTEKSGDYAVSLAKHVSVLKRGGTMSVLPEGGGYSHRETPRGKARGGVAYLAEATDAVILPLHIDGLWRLNEKDFWKRTRHATATYGKPFFLSDFGSYDHTDPNRYHQLGEKILDRIYSAEE